MHISTGLTATTMTLREAVSRRRLLKQQSAREAAEATGVLSYQGLLDIEKGISFNPKFAVCVGLARWLGVDLNTLGQYILASQRKAGAVTNGRKDQEPKTLEATLLRRADLFRAIHERDGDMSSVLCEDTEPHTDVVTDEKPSP